MSLNFRFRVYDMSRRVLLLSIVQYKTTAHWPIHSPVMSFSGEEIENNRNSCCVIKDNNNACTSQSGE